MTGSVGVGGAWKAIASNTAVGVSGAWKTIAKAWMGVGGVWKVWFENALFYVGDSGTYEDFDTFASGSGALDITYNSNGTFTIAAQTNGALASSNWVTPTSVAPGAYTIRLTVNSGSSPSGGSSATGVDLALTSNRTWNWNRSSSGFTGANVTVELKDGGGTVIASAVFDVSVTVP